MTDTEVQAAANVIRAEANRIQQEYNTGYLDLYGRNIDEGLRHNRELEDIERGKLKVDSEYKTRAANLNEQIEKRTTRIAELDLKLKYANEAEKNELTRERNQLERENNDLIRDRNTMQSNYETRIANIEQQKADVDSAYKGAQTEIQGLLAENDKLRVQADVLYKDVQSQLAAMEEERKEEEMVWRNFFENANLQARQQELNSIDTYRQEQIKTQRIGQGIDAVVDIFQTIIKAVTNPLSQVATIGEMASQRSARQMWDDLWR